MLRFTLLRSVPATAALLALVACGDAVTESPAAPHAAPAVAPAHVAAPVGAAPVVAAPVGAAPATLPATPPAAGAADRTLLEERSGVTTNGAFVVTWAPVPDPIPFNEAWKLAVTVARAASPTVPESGARLELDATMPAHGHGMNRTPRVITNGDGTFVVEGMLFHMSGEWNLVFHVYVGTEYGQVILRVELP